jgi:hypothetical protein
VLGVAQTVGLQVNDAAIMENGDASAGDVGGLEQFAHRGINLRCCDRSAVGARDGRLLQS